MSNIKGSNILNRLAFLTERFGTSAEKRLLEALPPADAKRLQPRVLATAWYPFDLYNRMDQTMADVFASGNLEICREAGADSARRALSRTYRAFLKDGPGPLLQRLAGLHSTFYDAGEMKVTLLDTGRAVIRNTYVPRSTQSNCMVAAGFYRGVVEMCGGRSVRVTEGGCSATGATHCLFNIIWS